MKVKRLITMIIALIMTVSCTHGAFAERIKFTEPEISSAEDVTTVTYTLTEMPAGEGATLIAAYIERESGNILSINSVTSEDVSLLEDGKITLTLADKSAEGGVLKHWLWTNLNSVISLNDGAPDKVAEVKAIPDASSPSSKINLSWNASEDDWDAAEDLKYNVYDMGIPIAEGVSQKAFSAEKLKWGSKYAFEVESVDSSGKVSERNSGGMVETIYPNSLLTTDTITSTDNNLIFTSQAWQEAPEAPGSAAWYYCYKDAVMDNLPCVATSVRKGLGTYHSVKFSDELLADLRGDGEFIFEIEYLSTGNGYMTLELYQTENGADKNENFKFDIVNDGKWNVLTKKVTVTNDFQAEGRKGHNYSHLRFVGGNSVATSVEPFYIRRITIMPVDEYIASNPTRDAYLDVQASTVSNGLGISDGATPQVVDGVYGIEANGLTVNAASNVTVGEATGIEIMYYAPEGVENFTVNGETINVTESGKWQKARIDLEGGLSGASIVIDGGVYINNIRLINGLPAFS